MAFSKWILAIAAAFLLTIAAALHRIKLILNPRRAKPVRRGRNNPHEPTHLLVVLGSGGHTAEMMSMLERAKSNPEQGSRLKFLGFTHRTWVFSEGDGLSALRAKRFEDDLAETQDQIPPSDRTGSTVSSTSTSQRKAFDIISVPRARVIHQSLLTTPISALKCMVFCIRVLTTHTDPKGIDFPDVILCNGPATATILIFTSVILRFFNIRGCNSRGKMRTIYVESWARVTRLSLSGRLLYRVVDRFLVQWPQLEAQYSHNGRGRAEFVGVLV